MSLETLRGCPSRAERYAPIELECETRQEYATEFIQIFRRHRLITGEPTTFAELLNVFRLAGELYDSGWRMSDEGSPFESRSLIEERQRAQQGQDHEGWTKKALPSVANQQQEPQTRIQPITGVAE